MQQRALNNSYTGTMEIGEMARDGSTVTNVRNEGLLAQALDMVRNQPRGMLTVQALRRTVDNAQYPLGPSHTSIGNMNVHSHSSAADDCVRNNQLTSSVPPGMSENDTITEAVKNSTVQPIKMATLP